MIRYVRKIRDELVRLFGVYPDDYFGKPSYLLYDEEVFDQFLEYLYVIGYEEGLQEGLAGNAGRVKIWRYTDEGKRDCSYISIRDAARKNGVGRKSLYDALNNGWKCGGFYWCRDGEVLDRGVIENRREESINNQVDVTGIRVEKVEPSGFVVGGPYRSIRDAALKNGLNDRYLGRVLDTDKLYAGHYWRKK